MGRKNHYGSRSERGTRVAALFYSLIESAKLCGIESHAYCGEVARRAIPNPTGVTLGRELDYSTAMQASSILDAPARPRTHTQGDLECPAGR